VKTAEVEVAAAEARSKKTNGDSRINESRDAHLPKRYCKTTFIRKTREIFSYTLFP